MKRWIKEPLAWVLGSAVLVFCWLWTNGTLEPQVQTDTVTYESVDFSSAAETFSSIRTVGYPVVLQVVRRVGGGYTALPYIHFAMYVAALLVLCRSLQAVGFSAGAAGSTCVLLVFSRATFELSAVIGPDSLALTTAILTVSALLVSVKYPERQTAWIWLALAMFASYQLRPVYLFLLPMVLFLGGGWALFVFDYPLRSWRIARLLACLSIAAVLPLLLFCGFRWFAVGHFGLVSFGGYNLIGISGQLMDEELIPLLSPDVQPLSASLLDRREAFPDWKAPIDYAAMEAMYNPMVWQVAIPAAEELHGKDPTRVNQAVGKLAREIIHLRKEQYVRWLLLAGREAEHALLCRFITDKGTRIGLLGFLGLQILAIAKRTRHGRLPLSLAPSDGRFLEVNVLLGVTFGFATAKLLLVILVEVPIDRYVIPAAFWGPGLVALACWYRAQQVFRS